MRSVKRNGAKSRGPSIAQLRALEAVARLGSFSAAAKELGISQPSVSTQVAAVERFSRTVLLTRSGYSIAASPVLEGVLPQVRALLALYGDIEGAFLSVRDIGSGTLRIGYSTYQVAMPVIGRFMQAYPGIEIEARSLASADVLDGLERGRLDVGFVTGREIPAHMTGTRILETPIILVAPPDHPLAATGRADWAEIAGLPLVMREKTSGTRRLFEGAARLARVELHSVLALGSWGSIVAMVREGVGIGVAMQAELAEREGLVPITIADGRLTAAHFAVCLRDMAHVAAVEAFLRLTVENDDTCVNAPNS